MTRLERLLSNINPAIQSGLEIGALCRPLIAPDTGPIRYVDHLDTAGLRAKYADDPYVDIDKIVDVSFIWGEQTLPQAVGDERFDYVIASHVIEHVPNTLGWFKEIAEVLQPGGVLSLAIPDKRFTFDCRRELTTFASVLEAYFDQRRLPSFSQVVDCATEDIVPDQVPIAALWRGTVDPQFLPYAKPTLLIDHGEAGLRQYYDDIKNGRYIDVHCQVYTPASFLHILSRLAEADMCPFKITTFFDTQHGDIEFFVTLEKLPPNLGRDERLAIVMNSIHLAKQQISAHPTQG